MTIIYDMNDNTEGLNAFLSLSESYYIGPRNLDVGGDPFLTPLIEDVLDISNTVYNPYISKYNILSDKKYDTVTSFSVLNILVKKEREQYLLDKKLARSHIELCIWYLVPNKGRIYIKVYEGDRSNKGGKKLHQKYIQTNMHWLKYKELLFDISNDNGCELYVDYLTNTFVIKNY